jgi:hypothetical protein
MDDRFGKRSCRKRARGKKYTLRIHGQLHAVLLHKFPKEELSRLVDVRPAGILGAIAPEGGLFCDDG